MADATPGSTAPSSNRKVMIVLSYLWLLALVPLLTEKEDREVQWHAKHGIVLMVAEIVLWVVITMVNIVTGFFIGCLVGLLSLFLWVGHRHPAHPVHHEGHQRPAPDHSGRQPVRGQVLSRRLLVLIVSAASVLLVADLTRPPAAQLTTRAALGAIHVYQATLSPLYARAGVICRFKTTCSHYGEAVVREFGAVKRRLAGVQARAALRPVDAGGNGGRPADA